MKKIRNILHYARWFIPNVYTWGLMNAIRKGRTYEQLDKDPFVVIVGKFLLLVAGLDTFRKFDWGWFYDYAEDLIDYEESPFEWITLP